MTTDVHPSDVLVPRCLWAQRSDKIYLTIEVFGVKDEKIDLSADTLVFSGTRSEDGSKFAVTLEFFAPIDVPTSKYQTSPRDITFILMKADDTQSYWPRLVKEKAKMHYIMVDFSKWVDEDEEGTDPPADNQFDFGGMNFGGGSGFDMGGMGGQDSFDPSEFSKYSKDYDSDEEGPNIDDVSDEEEPAKETTD